MDIKVFIVEDHAIVRDGIKALLMPENDIKVVGDCAGADSLFELLKTSQPDLLLLDITLPGMSGIKIAEKAKKEYPDIKIIMLTAESSEENIFNSVNIGANGFLNKNIERDELIEAVKTVCAGNEYFDKSVSKTLVNTLKNSFIHKPVLTKRETEIVKYIARGFAHKQIAKELYISKRTVDSHVANIMDKLGVNSKAGIIRFAYKNRLVKL